MTGPKLNEKNFVAGEKAGTRASALYVRSSASKARLVLNIIRDLPVKQADEVLQFTDKSIAVVVRKVLASAVANAQHNDQQDPEELFIKACFADEGPTLRRFAARARGRGTRINKRTCHITIVVDRLDDLRLSVLQAKEANSTAAGRRRGATGTTAARRDRVARSRERAQGLRAGGGSAATEADAADEIVESLDANAPDAVDSTAVLAADVAADAAETNEVEATDVADAEPADTETTDAEAGDEGVDDTPDTDESAEKDEK
jgi:large subunit ribosomal protein L22